MFLASSMHSVSRSRQFKVLLSEQEWYDLLEIAETEETTIADVLRTFITRRAYELKHPATRDVRCMADALSDFSRRLRALAAFAERLPVMRDKDEP